MNKVLVFAAHPDDEVLGCGATIAKHIDRGDSVKVVIAAEGLTSRQFVRDEVSLSSNLEDLKNTCIKANAALGVSQIEFYQFPDNRMDSVDLLDIIKKIEGSIDSFRPDIVYTHWPRDLNIDHRILGQAVLTATRPIPEQTIKDLYFFEIPSSTDWMFTGNADDHFNANVFSDVGETINKKIEALNIYNVEMRPYPHSRSIENLINISKVRGASVGVPYAEAFVLARKIAK